MADAPKAATKAAPEPDDAQEKPSLSGRFLQVLGTTVRVAGAVGTLGLSEAGIALNRRLTRKKSDGTEEEVEFPEQENAVADPIPAPLPIPTPVIVAAPTPVAVTVTPAAPAAPALAAAPVSGVAAALKAKMDAKEAELAAERNAHAQTRAAHEAVKADLAKVTTDRDAQNQSAVAQAGRAANMEAAFRDAEGKRVAAETRAANAEAELLAIKTAFGV